MLNPGEFPELSGLENQIEWREFVAFGELPAEMARFDINLAPLEHGNPYVEAKSELKYFDAALVRVPTIASPTRPFATAIQHGVNGLLAATPDEWAEGLSRLVEDDELRQRLAQAAFHHTLAAFGPLAHLRKVERVIAMIRGTEGTKALAFRSDVADLDRGWKMPPCSEAEQLFVHFSGNAPEVAIVMPVYNYAGYVSEALDSVKAQSVANLELIIVNDASTDESLDIMLAWVHRNKSRFCRVAVFSNVYNSGLGLSRNRAITEARARYVLPLDADNKLHPECAATLMRAIRKTPVAFAYPFIQQFGEAYEKMGCQSWQPLLLACCNYIDAMALLDKCAWSDVGGYKAERSGWEDYDFWCRLAEAGYWGIQVTDAMAYYRKHGNSMLHTFTEASDQRARIAEAFRIRHHWIDVPGY
jgi:hypothetical protein